MFVYDAVLEAIMTGNTTIPRSSFHSTYEEMLSHEDGEKSEMEKQHEVCTVLFIFPLHFFFLFSTRHLFLHFVCSSILFYHSFSSCQVLTSCVLSFLNVFLKNFLKTEFSSGSTCLLSYLYIDDDCLLTFTVKHSNELRF